MSGIFYYLTFLTDFQPLEIQASSYHKTPAQIHDVSYIDPDFKRIDQQLKNWNITLNKMVLVSCYFQSCLASTPPSIFYDVIILIKSCLVCAGGDEPDED